MILQEEIRETKLLKLEADALQALETNALIGSDAWKESKKILEETIQREQNADNGDETKRSDWQKLMNLVMQLRKIW